MRILLVEDDHALTQSMVATLKAAAMVVDAVKSGEEALEYCRLWTP
jgi:DNA-binding response OmpR family regulator